MTTADVTPTQRRPEPPKADFAFEIDFNRGEGSASRVFAAINNFIRGCKRLDAELIQTIDTGIGGQVKTVYEVGRTKVKVATFYHEEGH